jgi:hypothetical protein
VRQNPHLDHDGVEEHGDVAAIERAGGPVLHLGHHGVGEPRNRLFDTDAP